MTKRTLVLIGLLAVSYILMAVYLAWQYPKQGHQVVMIGFGVVLIVAALIGARISSMGNRTKGTIRALKILFASFAISFAVWMGLSILLLPLIEFKGLELVRNWWFGYALLGGAIAASPLVAKKLT